MTCFKESRKTKPNKCQQKVTRQGLRSIKHKVREVCRSVGLCHRHTTLPFKVWVGYASFTVWLHLTASSLYVSSTVTFITLSRWKTWWVWGTLIQTWRLHTFNPRPNNPTGRSEPGLNSKAFQLLQENKSVFLLNKSCSYGISFLYTCYLYKVTVNIAIYFLEYFQLSFFLAAFVKCWHDRGKVH